jgi:hypothetical protein
LCGPGRYTSTSDILLDAIWDKGSITQFIQTYPGGCSCGDETVVVSTFVCFILFVLFRSQFQGRRLSIPRLFQFIYYSIIIKGDHRNFGERHGYGCQVINQVRRKFHYFYLFSNYEVKESISVARRGMTIYDL